MMAKQANRRTPNAQPPDGRSWKWLGVLGVVVCLAVALTATTQYLLAPSTLPILQVHVEGEFRQLTPEAVEGIVGAEVRTGFFAVDVEAVRAALLGNPWVHDATVRRVWPDSLKVTILEQSAAAYWGVSALLNPHGVAFHPATASFPAGLVQLEGPAGSESLVLGRYRQLAAILEPHKQDLSSVHLSGRRAWSFQLKQGPHVIIGRADVDARLERFGRALGGVLASQLQDIQVVDMRYPNGFAVNRRIQASADNA